MMIDERSAVRPGKLVTRIADAAVRRLAKATVLPLGVAGRRRAGDVTILLYHRAGAGDRQIDIGADAFERQLAEIVDRDRVLTLDAALDPAESTGGVVLTFDDGLADFRDHVVPALVRHRVPALLYLATGFVLGEGRGERQVEFSEQEQLTWSQLRDCLDTGLVTVGSHTHTHADLSRATASVAKDEMYRSKELIEDRLGVSCRHFAYPWSVASQGAERAARELFASAALGAWHTNRRGRIDPHRLGRTPVLRSDGRLFFGAKRRGVLDSEALLYRAMRRGPWGRR